MLFNITHKTNQMAFDIVAFLETKGSIISRKEYNIAGSAHLNIIAQCGTSDREYVINNPKAIENSLDNNFIQEILSVNGIRYESNPSDLLARTLHFLVYEMAIISIKQVVYGKIANQIKYIEEDECKKIADLAKRVIYLMGLDYAMVTISVTGNKKVKISWVDSSPLIREKDMKLVLRKLERLIDNTNDLGINEIKMGADPEFMMCNAKNGKMIPASQFFPHEGVVGCDNIRIPSRQQRPVGELRPKPDCSPLQLFNNIKQALRYAAKLAPYRNIKMLAGSQPYRGYSIGGHIHFSNILINNHILRALDSYVGLPLFLIENKVTAAKRRKRYGFLADIRLKDHGGFEYRTPGSWLVSPEIAIAVLCLGKIVASNYLKMSRNCFFSVEAQRAFYEGNQDYLRPFFNDIWSDIQELSMFKAFEEELRIIPYMVKNGICWDERADIRKTWAVNSVSTQHYDTPSTPKSINSPTAIRNTSQSQNATRGRRSSGSTRVLGPAYFTSHNF